MKTVHIVAKGTGWEDAPIEGEVWGVNDVVSMRDVDLCFFMDRGQLYDMEPKEAQKLRNESIYSEPQMTALEMTDKVVTRAVNEKKVPMFSTRKFEDIPTSMPYPKDEIVSFFGTDFFGNSVDFMIAYAIYQGYEVIHFYGVNMAYGTEFHHEKPPTSFWLGVALGMGIELHIHGEKSELLKTHTGKVYAYFERQISIDGGVKRAKSPTDVEKIRFSENKTVKLNAGERVILTEFLAEKGTYQGILELKEFKKTIGFTEEEYRQLKHELQKDPVSGKTERKVRYVDDMVPEVEYDISPFIAKKIKALMLEYEKHGNLIPAHMRLYKTFVLGEE